MTPAARIQAAIEILNELRATDAAADNFLRAWARDHRYAGSKDRAAIAERVYDVLRRRNECSDAMGGRSDARDLVLGSLALETNRDVAAIEALFNGVGHAPQPLCDDERAILSAPHTPSTALHVAANVPEWIVPDATRLFGDKTRAELMALQGRAPLDLRVNTLRGNRTDAIAALAADGIEAAPFGKLPHTLRVSSGARIDSARAVEDGLVEVQDAASQIASSLVDAQPGMAVIDLCAGAGGKTLAMAAAMNGTGRLIACDIDHRRLERLKPRADRARAFNVTVRELRHDWLDRPATDAFSETADRVLVDAPCSGSGTWRRNPETKWRLTPEKLAGYTQMQSRLLDRAATLVAAGGRLIFATCSILPEEGEDQVAAFLARQPGFTHVQSTRLTPHRDNTDGFFVAVFARKEGVR